MDDIARLRAVCCCASWRWVEEPRIPPFCGARHLLGVRSRSDTGDGGPSQTLMRRGPIPKADSEGRGRKFWRFDRARCFGMGGILSATHADRWMAFWTHV